MERKRLIYVHNLGNCTLQKSFQVFATVQVLGYDAVSPVVISRPFEITYCPLFEFMYVPTPEDENSTLSRNVRKRLLSVVLSSSDNGYTFMQDSHLQKDTAFCTPSFKIIT